MREIEHGSSLFLLYGDTGVGKSRLLDQLVTRRLAEHNCHSLDFEQSDNTDMDEAFGKLAREASQGDVIVVDHFESASNRAQDQIFKSWLTDGRDKNLNVIIVAISTSFNAFRQLAQQYQVEARSFQLMPCSTAEVESYLQFRLFPDDAFGELNMPSAVKKQVRQSNGVLARINEIIERDGDSISLGSARERNLLSRSAPVIGFLTLILAIAGFYYYQQIIPVSSPSIVSDVEEAKSDETDPQSEDDQTVEEAEMVDEPESMKNVEVDNNVENTDVVEAPISEITQTEITEPEIAEAELVKPEIAEPQISEPVEVVATETVEPASTIPDADVADNSGIDWFQKLLITSLDWIKQGDQQRGTIQVMSIGFDRFDQSAYRTYLDELTGAGIDTSQVRIFKTRAGTQEVYSIIFGEFEDRREANRQIQSLPEVIGADSPIPRSTGSINREIEQFAEP